MNRSLSALLVPMTICAIACGPLDVARIPTSELVVDTVVHSVVISPPTALLDVGQQTTLAASVDAGAGVILRTVRWSTSNAVVATVDTVGRVTAGMLAGTATITATSKADTSVKGIAQVTVKAGTP